MLLGGVKIYHRLVCAVAASAAARQSTQEASTGTSSGLIRRVSWGKISLSTVAGNAYGGSGIAVLGGNGVGSSHSICVGSHSLLVQRHSVHIMTEVW